MSETKLASKVLFRKRVNGIGTFKVVDHGYPMPVLIFDLHKSGAARWDSNFDSRITMMHEIRAFYAVEKRKNKSIPKRSSAEVRYQGRFVSMVSLPWEDINV